MHAVEVTSNHARADDAEGPVMLKMVAEMVVTLSDVSDPINEIGRLIY